MSPVNNPTVYLFKDGFFSNLIQCGSHDFGQATYNSGQYYTVTLAYPKAYAFAPYVFVTAIHGLPGTTFLNHGAQSITATTFEIVFVYGQTLSEDPVFEWVAMGLGA